MKPNKTRQQWTRAALLGLILTGSASLCLGADITYNFDSDVQGWYAADGHGSVAWSGTNGRGGNGCLKCTIVSDGTTGDTEIDPRVDVAYDTTGYFSVEYDMMIDADSGTDTGGNYGNLQIVDWNAAWNWHSEWYGSLGGPGGAFSGTWKHVVQPFTATYGSRVRLAFQIAASAAPYTTNVVIYIDNVVIRDGTPPNKAALYSFAWPEQCKPDNSWGAGPPVFTQDTTLNTNGCLKEVVVYDGSSTNWQDAPAELHTPTFDPSKFTYMDFDLYLDAPTGLSSYGQYQLHYWYSWTSIGAVSLSAANIGKWTHYSFTLPAGTPNGVVLHPGGNPPLSGTFTYYLANVTLWKPAEPPTIKSMVKASGLGGVQIIMDDNSSQYEREAIVTPSGDGSHAWALQGNYPVSYSFTITNFPDAKIHGGFEAHMYFVNADTAGGVTGWNATYGGVDWNATDLLKFAVENNAAGGVIAHIDWKTNLPGANPLTNALYHPVSVNGPTAIGTWTLTFTSATDGTVTGPGITATNFTLPAEAVANNFSPAGDYVQFGMFKNDGANNGHNNQAAGIFGQVQMVAGGNTVFDDTFPGPNLTANYAWRKTTSSGGASSVQWVPPGIAYWLTWSMPDDGFEAYVAGTVNGTYTDAGVGATTGFSYTKGALKIGGIPAANMPPNANEASFFLLKK